MCISAFLILCTGVILASVLGGRSGLSSLIASGRQGKDMLGDLWTLPWKSCAKNHVSLSLHAWCPLDLYLQFAQPVCLLLIFRNLKLVCSDTWQFSVLDPSMAHHLSMHVHMQLLSQDFNMQLALALAQ